MSAKVLFVSLLLCGLALHQADSQEVFEVRITCEFQNFTIYDYTNYACIVRGLNFNFSNPFYYIHVEGEHEEGRTDDDVRNLVFEDSEINQIPGNIFQVFRNIQAIGASNSGITALTANDLNFARELAAIFFSDNQITSLTGTPFLWNVIRTTITHLNFYSNRIEFIGDTFFNGLTNLRYLSLGGNALTSLPPQVIAPLTGLRELLVSFNQIESLSARVFATNRQLEIVAFEFNNITALGPGIFDDLPSIEFIGLLGNECVSFEFEIDDEMTIDVVNEQLGGCFDNSIPDPPRRRQVVFELFGNMTLNNDFGEEIANVVGREWN